MMDDIQQQPNAGSQAPETTASVTTGAESANFTSTGETTSSTTTGKPCRGRNGRRQSAPKTTDERFSESMEAVYNKSAGDDGQQSAPVVTPGESEDPYGAFGSAIDSLAANFDSLPPETQAHLRQVID